MLGDIISAGAKIAGGLIGDQSNAKQQEANRALQREFAQSGIQWKVADAKKAGIHPMAALGSSVSMPSVSVQPSGLGAAVGSMGQDLSRAIASTAQPEAVDMAYQEAVKQLSLTNFTLRNDLLASQIARLRQGGSMPGLGRANNKDVPADSVAFNRTGQEPTPGPQKTLVMDNMPVRGHPGWSPTQEVADQYGDENPMVSYIYGPMKFYMDWKYTNAARWEMNRRMNREDRRERYEKSLRGHR